MITKTITSKNDNRKCEKNRLDLKIIILSDNIPKTIKSTVLNNQKAKKDSYKACFRCTMISFVPLQTLYVTCPPLDLTSLTVQQFTPELKAIFFCFCAVISTNIFTALS